MTKKSLITYIIPTYNESTNIVALYKKIKENPIPNMEGERIVSSNLTFHETGLKDWSEEKFIRAVKHGIVEGEDALRYPMTPFTKLTDYEASAIYAYLKSVPPIDNKVDRKLASK